MLSLQLVILAVSGNESTAQHDLKKVCQAFWYTTPLIKYSEENDFEIILHFVTKDNVLLV